MNTEKLEDQKFSETYSNASNLNLEWGLPEQLVADVLLHEGVWCIFAKEVSVGLRSVVEHEWWGEYWEWEFWPGWAYWLAEKTWFCKAKVGWGLENQWVLCWVW